MTLSGTATKAFTWNGHGTIQLNTAPAANAVVGIVRETPRTRPLVDFTDGSNLTEIELDRACLQLLYIVQEAIDLASNSLQYIPEEGLYDAGGRPISNVGDPLDADDVLTLGYYNRKLWPDVKEYVRTEIDGTIGEIDKKFEETRKYLEASFEELKEYVNDKFGEVFGEYNSLIAQLEQIVNDAIQAVNRADEQIEAAKALIDKAEQESGKAYIYYLNTKRFVFRGTWQDGGIYEPYNVVEYCGSSYLLKEGDGLTPPPDPSVWQLVAQAGRDFIVNSLDGGRADSTYIVYVSGGAA